MQVLEAAEFEAEGSLARGRDGIGLFVEGPEPPGEIVREGGGIVQGAGVEPDAAGARGPGALDSLGQQMLAIAAPDEIRKQAEIGDLDRSIRGGLELEESGGGGVDSQEPEGYGGTREMGADLL